jgi:hypothetical protein
MMMSVALGVRTGIASAGHFTSAGHVIENVPVE